MLAEEIDFHQVLKINPTAMALLTADLVIVDVNEAFLKDAERSHPLSAVTIPLHGIRDGRAAHRPADSYRDEQRPGSPRILAPAGRDVPALVQSAVAQLHFATHPDAERAVAATASSGTSTRTATSTSPLAPAEPPRGD
jgi:hypothetical protein